MVKFEMNSSKITKSDIGFVCCIERGMLEYKALCMLLTFRRNWPDYSDVPIYAYSPRPSCIVSDWLLVFYSKLNVKLVDTPLNLDYSDYPLANKPLSMAHAEANLSCDILVFLDSDILCWNYPKQFHLDTEKSIAMVVDSTKTVASSGKFDKEYEKQWQDLYKLAGVEHFPFVNTWLDKQSVRGWWNTGVIVVRRDRGLMQEWLSLFKSALESIKFTPDSYYLREQMSLCAVTAKHYPHFQELPLGYNYPVQSFEHYVKLGYSPEDAALWHYQPYMNKSFVKFKRSIDQCSSFEERHKIAEKFIQRCETSYHRMIGLDESFLVRIRKKAKIGPRLRKFLGRAKASDSKV